MDPTHRHGLYLTTRPTANRKAWTAARTRAGIISQEERYSHRFLDEPIFCDEFRCNEVYLGLNDKTKDKRDFVPCFRTRASRLKHYIAEHGRFNP